jgi:hypothetical protein
MGVKTDSKGENSTQKTKPEGSKKICQLVSQKSKKTLIE